jgi:hypothetical protein
MTIAQKDLWNLITAGEVRRVAEALRADPGLVAMRSVPDQDTPLHYACWQKQLAIVGLLLGYAPDVNAQGDAGRTPLHYAVYEGRAISGSIVGALLAAGADPLIVDDDGVGVADSARSEMSDGLAEVLDMIDRWRARNHK